MNYWSGARHLPNVFSVDEIPAADTSKLGIIAVLTESFRIFHLTEIRVGRLPSEQGHVYGGCLQRAPRAGALDLLSSPFVYPARTLGDAETGRAPDFRT